MGFLSLHTWKKEKFLYYEIGNRQTHPGGTISRHGNANIYRRNMAEQSCQLHIHKTDQSYIFSQCNFLTQNIKKIIFNA